MICHTFIKFEIFQYKNAKENKNNIEQIKGTTMFLVKKILL